MRSESKRGGAFQTLVVSSFITMDPLKMGWRQLVRHLHMSFLVLFIPNKWN